MSLVPRNPRSDDTDFAHIEMAMSSRQSGIEPKDRCTVCDGRGLVPLKKTMTYTEYIPCIVCKGSGRKMSVVK